MKIACGGFYVDSSSLKNLHGVLTIPDKTTVAKTISPCGQPFDANVFDMVGRCLTMKGADKNVVPMKAPCSVLLDGRYFKIVDGVISYQGKIKLTIVVYDETTGDNIDNATIVVKDYLTDVVIEPIPGTVNEFYLNANQDVNIFVSAVGYQDNELSGFRFQSDEEFYVSLEPSSPWQDSQYVTFSSPNPFTISTKNGEKGWNGTIEYSTEESPVVGTEWDGTEIAAQELNGEYVLKMRGVLNQRFVGDIYDVDNANSWAIDGTDVSVNGPFCSLMTWDPNYIYNHPEVYKNPLYVYDYGAARMFYGCTALIKAMDFDTDEYQEAWSYNNQISQESFIQMFANCTSLVDGPSSWLRENMTSSGDNVCESMFSGCSSLKTAPNLPCTNSNGSFLYPQMFENCTSLETPPAIASTYGCFRGMFANCTALTSVPDLSNVETMLQEGCADMFSGCTALTNVPEILPCMSLYDNCYEGMFRSTSITRTPKLPATTLADGCYSHMFESCRQLEAITELPATELPGYCYEDMFADTTIQLATEPIGSSINPYRIPSAGEGTAEDSSLQNMFRGLSPEINTTYYIDREIIPIND